VQRKISAQTVYDKKIANLLCNTMPVFLAYLKGDVNLGHLIKEIEQGI